MAIFNSYVSLPEGIRILTLDWVNHRTPWAIELIAIRNFQRVSATVPMTETMKPQRFPCHPFFPEKNE